MDSSRRSIVYLLLACCCIAAAATTVCAADEPPADQAPQIPRLIEQLGNENYFVRERAQSELAKIGFAAFDALEAAEEHEDIEIAARAKYLVSQMQIEWTVDSDPPEVKRLMQNYGQKGEGGHPAVVAQLVDLPHDKGLAVLCRLVRFDKSAFTSKLAALAVIEQRGVSVQRRLARDQVIAETIGTSPRPGAQWLRAYLVSRKDPAIGAEQWGRLAEAEQRLFVQQPQETRPQILRALRRQQIAVLKKLDRRDDAVASMMKIVDLEEGHSETLIELVNWLVEQEAWSVLDVVATRFADRFEQEAILLYSLAQAQLVQGNDAAAEKMADRAFALSDGTPPAPAAAPAPVVPSIPRPMVPPKPGQQPGAPRDVSPVALENLFHHYEVGSELQRRGLLKWCRREYEHVIGKAPQGEMLSLFTQHRMAELLHDQADDLGAAKLFEDMVAARESKEKDGPQNLDRLGSLATLRARMRFFRACALEKSGHPDSQLNELKLGLESDPKEVDVLIALYRHPEIPTELKEKTRRFIRSAANDFRQDIQESPEDPMPYNQLAWLIANTEGDRQEAIRMSEKSLELARSISDERNNHNSEAGYLDTLARCHYAAGDIDGAIEIQARAVELDPHSGQMKKQLEAFKQEAAEGQKPR